MVQSYLCHPFCSFFRAGVKEEMACQGALVLAELVLRGCLVPATLPSPGEKARRRWQKEDLELERLLCRPCPFAVDGCDFHSDRRSAETEPCGGYLLLQLLRERGRLSGSVLAAAAEGAAHVA
ncbi:MAG: hypothetical protein CVU69_06680 [Deltaproteobacteria bacterium HGW-Deltaproteobacteria-4]|nr:MAG: hypothetical protein CVU69_06680 [Deltaproteobacteria bacterium HGW-Deltaproteobacteria-4]